MLKNYRARTNAKESPIEKIQRILIAHRAKSLSFQYNSEGKVIAVMFSMDIKQQEYWFKLPARVENVEKIMYGTTNIPPQKKEQAYTTAWANIRDWVDAQMALIDTQMAKTEEVFMPYLMVDKEGTTLFEKYEDQGFKKLASGVVEGEVVE